MFRKVSIVYVMSIFALRTKQVKRRAGPAKRFGSTEKCIGHRDYRDPEMPASPRKKHLSRLTRVVTCSKSRRSIRIGEDVESRRGSQAVACA